MLQDARQLPDRAIVSADICIVGAGAAGITLARALRSRQRSIVLLESGGLEFDAPTQALYQGTAVGATLPRRYLTSSRLRFFGGSTNHWNGMCRPLEPLDFAVRPWLPDSGWPIGRDDLAPFYRDAAALLQFAPFDDDWGTVSTPGTSLVRPGGPFVGRTFRMSPPTRFGQVYRDELATADDVDVLLWANAVQLDLDAAGARVEALQAATLPGRRLTIRAGTFVLATGGIENARLLLASNTVQRAGIGNGSDCVGRYFMEHPEVSAMQVMVTDHAVFGDLFRERDTMLCPTEATQRTHEILNVNVQFIVDTPPAASPAGLPLDVAPAFKAIDGERPAAAADPLPDYLSCYIRGESAPRRDNRVTLDRDDVDALGMPRPRLAFAMGTLETRTVSRVVDLLAREFGARSSGRVRFTFPDEALQSALGEPPWRALQQGNHHMGTTRMSHSPAGGVVDGDGRVHGVANLYVAGSSVFPTCGMANPTFTIVALALRLAAHLAARAALRAGA